jgi:putative PIN family toxin of toxin-antitoxin system
VRAVLDLNVFVSSLINPDGVPATIVRLGLQRHYEIVVCPRLTAELEEVLHRPAFRRYFSEEEATEFVSALAGASHEADDPSHVERVSRDPDDDYLVALAVSAGAERVVSGDPDLLDVGAPAVPVVSPATFRDELGLP